MGGPVVLRGPNFEEPFPLDQLRQGEPAMGHFRGEPVILVRQGEEVLAMGGSCAHYGAPLDEGLVVADTLRCPWHHARFSLRTGANLAAPALSPVSSYRVERDARGVWIAGKFESAPRRRPRVMPSSVVIVGTGAAGSAGAETLRQEGYAGTITVIGEDPAPPYDRPNLSKDYLAGSAPPEWIPLRPPEYYRDLSIDLRTGMVAKDINVREHSLVLAGGEALPFGTLLLATGARPRRLSIPGAERKHVHTLRSLADSEAIIERAKTAKRALVVGAGFVGLEVAAALRTRGLDVHVVAPDERPLERVLGASLGDMIRTIHESHGAVFHLKRTLASIGEDDVVLSDGTRLAAELVVIGAGVEPDIDLAQRAGLAVDRGVKVTPFLETSEAGIFAAGDIARWPDPHTGRAIRVEHWAVAQRQGQTAARNMLGAKERFAAVPFFWSAHYDVTVSYVGHGEGWERVEVEGDPMIHDCRVTYWRGDQRLAVATVGRDRDSLLAEAEMESRIQGRANYDT
jgi:NADPH-dependent 2,4-dienoyl-CoA reductase/sulfur reductase-like enzyme/nitrite reductase/ring-hydroxylating ferredoxin subunit